MEDVLLLERGPEAYVDTYFLRDVELIKVGGVKLGTTRSAERQADSGDQVGLAGIVGPTTATRFRSPGSSTTTFSGPKLRRLLISIRSILTRTSWRHAASIRRPSASQCERDFGDRKRSRVRSARG
jgi:hypothetical protein